MRPKLPLIRLWIFFSILFIGNISYAQRKEISGKVTDSNTGQPIVGSTVGVKGSTIATQTNDAGNFTITVPGSNSRLVISSVGYDPQEVTVGSQNDVTVALKGATSTLNEVVVTALGIKKERKALGYSITEVKGDELTQARSINVANSLVGKVAGLNITSTATGPGGSTRITIRGNTSISRGNGPLIVVDGIPFNNDNLGSVGEWGGADQGDGISSLNPDEIESISVLKGGTAAALYGSRASNGAILVTTKSGSKSGKAPVIEIGSNFVAEDLLQKELKDYQYVYGTGDKGTGLTGEKPTSADPNLNQTNSWGAKLDGSSVIQYDGVSRPYVAVKDNFKKFYNTGTTFTNNFAIGGGNERISYRFTLADLTNKGIIPNSSLIRDNASININANLSKRFSVLVNGKYIREKNKNRPRVSDSPGSANYTLWTLPTSLSVETLKENKYNDKGYEKIWSNNQYVQNPYFAVEDYKENDLKDRFIGIVEPRFNLTDWLYVKGRAGFDKFTRRENDITPTGTGYQLGGGYNTNLRDFRETNLDLMLGVDKNLTEKVAINAIVGGNRMRQITSTDSYGGGPFNIPFFYAISNVSTPNRYTNNGYAEKRINSVYGTADISYGNYLFLNVTGRNDWFSTLAKNKNSIFYPSVGLSFVLSDALTLPDFVNFLKLRGSWAKTGGDSDPYALSLTYALTGATQGAPLAQINQSRVPNPALQPYEVTSTEVGLEGRLFNNRFGIDLALYDRKTTNDIVGASISPASGYTSALFNIGEVTNKGVELLLSYKIINTKNFSWEPSFNAAYNKSNVVQIYPGLDKLFVEEPRPRVSAIYQVINKPFAQILGNGFKRDSKTGQVIFNSQGLPETEGLKSFGSGISPWTLGFNNTFNIRGISVSFLIDAKYGGYIYSGTNALAYRYGLSKGTLPGRETGVIGQGVTEAGTPNAVVVPAQTYYNNLYNFAEPFVYSSDFIKLRQVIVGYNIPLKMIERTPIKGINISLVGRNLWTIMKHTPIIDPESVYSSNNAQGQEFAGLPATRTMGINLNLKF